MSIYENNLEILKQYHEDLYTQITGEDAQPSEDINILIGDALNGERFLVYQEGERIIALNSMYSPTHEAERYAAQFQPIVMGSAFLFFGLSNGLAIHKILEEKELINFCVVLEPSMLIFKKALQEFDLTDILKDARVSLLVGDIDFEKLELDIYKRITYDSWKRFRLCILSKYRELFSDTCAELIGLYNRVVSDREADLNTLIEYAETGMENEIQAMRWMMDCISYRSLEGNLDTEVPYIVVAAGPSLEKNVDILKRAKGKAVIVCVDTAAGFVLNHDIIPDMICCVDAEKELKLFEHPGIADIPIIVSTDTNYRVLERMGKCRPIYISISNDFLEREFQEKGLPVGYFDGGGSVATVLFQLGVELGFKRIVLVGQDLAFTDKKAHAGMGQYDDDDLVMGFSIVDGYDGGKVITREDLKNYIDWYNMRIPQLTGCEVINATEGGAKLKGAIQMPLTEVVDRYCTKICEVEPILNGLQSVWSTKEERQELYRDIEEKYKYFKGLQKRLKEVISDVERGIVLLQRGGYQKKELQRIDSNLARMTHEVEKKEGIVILVKRMIDTEASVTDDLHETEENPELETIRLYRKMHLYFSEMLQADEELLELWKEVMERIQADYKL